MRLVRNRYLLFVGVALLGTGAIRLHDYYEYGRAITIVTRSLPAESGEAVFWQALVILFFGALCVVKGLRLQTSGE